MCNFVHKIKQYNHIRADPKIEDKKLQRTPLRQPFFGMAASLVYILAMELYPLKSPERRRLPAAQATPIN